MAMAALWGIRQWTKEGQARRLFLKDRPRLSADDIYAQFYKDSTFDKASVMCIWELIGEFLRVDMGRLRPSDRLMDLHMDVAQWRDDVDDLMDYVAYMPTESSREPMEIVTIDDIVKLAIGEIERNGSRF